MLELDGENEGVVILETMAICKYLARVGPTGEGLLGGSSPLHQAKVEQSLCHTFA